MKKIITLLLAAILAVAPLGVAAENTENIFIEKLSSYSPEKRAQYIAMLRPFLTSDAGVEAGIDNVKSGLFEMMLGVTFTPQQEDMIIRTFKSMSCIKEDTGIRLKYADIFQNKIPTEISATTAYGIDRMIQAMGEKSPSTEKIIREDGYTAGVVANMLRIIPEVNKTALLEYKNGEFSVANVNSDFARDYDAVWAGYTDEEGKTVTAYGFALLLILMRMIMRHLNDLPWNESDFPIKRRIYLPTLKFQMVTLNTAYMPSGKYCRFWKPAILNHMQYFLQNFRIFSDIKNLYQSKMKSLPILSNLLMIITGKSRILNRVNNGI